MNKKLLLPVLVIVLALVGGVYFGLTRNKSDQLKIEVGQYNSQLEEYEHQVKTANNFAPAAEQEEWSKETQRQKAILDDLSSKIQSDPGFADHYRLGKLSRTNDVYGEPYRYIEPLQ